MTPEGSAGRVLKQMLERRKEGKQSRGASLC